MNVRARLVVLAVFGAVVGTASSLWLRPALAQVPLQPAAGAGLQQKLPAGAVVSQKLPSARVFKFSGVTTVNLVQTSTGLRVPPALTSQQRAAIATAALGGEPSQPGDRYFLVSARSPLAPGRGAIEARFPRVVDAFEDWYVFENPEDVDASSSPGFSFGPFAQLEALRPPIGHARLWIKSEGAGRRYLADCSVALNGPPQPFFQVAVRAPGLEQVATINDGAGHLVWAIVGTDANWREFEIVGPRGWALRSCEVTSL